MVVICFYFYEKLALRLIVIGSGIGGLSCALRLANRGCNVEVFESNEFPGGKISSRRLGGYRFDNGPSVLTEPELLTELFLASKEEPIEYYELEESCRYFFKDGHELIMPVGEDKVSKMLADELGENSSVTRNYLNNIRNNYESLKPVFIEISLHRYAHLFKSKLIPAIARLFKYGLFATMNNTNTQKFKNPKTIQILNRFATYNGSSPYKAPGLLNIIGHLELNVGPSLPKKGMNELTNRIYDACLNKGVKFHFNTKVDKILIDNNRIKGVLSKNKEFTADIVVSNMDVHFTYEKLLPSFQGPKKILNQEKSSSAIVFYWGIKHTFSKLGVHNILFSGDYEKEFSDIFDDKKMNNDPTIYIHITSKLIKEDAPHGCENWFVMVNAPIIEDQNWQETIASTRKNIIQRINTQLKTDIEKYIVEEEHMDPRIIESKYFGKQGSIYGNSSNSRYAAFYRHPNFSKKIKGLYFTGVTVHPGGGIPLALNASKIVERCILEDFSPDQTLK